MAVRTADWSAHILGSHFTCTHFIVEAVAVVTYQVLPKSHVLYQLLYPHFKKTIKVNASIRDFVPDIIADVLTPFSQRQCWELCARFYGMWSFEDSFVPRDLDRRGMQGRKSWYPYAGTAMVVWEEVKKFVEAIITNASSILGAPLATADPFVTQWAERLRNRIRGFPAMENNAILIDSLTMIIFTASHQHASVSSFQAKYAAYFPAGGF